jgi:hypothetical protein
MNCCVKREREGEREGERGEREREKERERERKKERLQLTVKPGLSETCGHPRQADNLVPLQTVIL